MNYKWIVTSIALFITLVVASFAGAETLDLPRLGHVALIDPAGPPSGLVILFSDIGSKDPTPHESLRALADAGQAVAVVNTDQYLAALDRTASECLRASDDLAALKSQLFQLLHLAPGASAVLAGPGCARWTRATSSGELISLYRKSSSIRRVLP
ncbi:MAG: hypothetical protein WAU91_14285 [Desulfatitalea sp.]